MRTLYLSLTIMVLFVTGCSTQNAYDSLRYHQDLDCQKMQGADRDECMKRAGTSYNEYQRQLNQQKQDK